MKKIKVIKHTTYETSDGREFDDMLEAKVWQEQLSELENVRMLDSDYKPIKNVDSAIYVYAKTQTQVEAFNAVAEDIGQYAVIHSIGFHRYDEASDTYVNILNEIERLQRLIDELKDGDEECTKDFFTHEDVLKMSRTEVRENYEKIIKSMERW